MNPSAIRTQILAMVDERGAEKTVCPSEVARALAGSDEKAWRLLMAPIRREAVALAVEGRVEIRRKGRPVDPHAFKGIYRLAPAADRVDQAEGSNASVRPLSQ